MKNTLTILGSNSALPVMGRHPSAQILSFNNQLILFDCGEATQIQLEKYKIKRSKISHIFITHMHGDHVFGLPGLISSYNHYNRTTPLSIHGPKGLKLMLEVTLGLTENPLRFKLDIHEHDPDVQQTIVDQAHFSVATVPLHHRIPTCGFILKSKGEKFHLNPTALETYAVPFSERGKLQEGQDFVKADGQVIKNELLVTKKDSPWSFAYISDTAFKPDIVPLIENVSLLYHEATFCHDLIDRAEITKHSTSKQAAEIAKLAKTKKLLIGHFSSRYINLNPLLNEAREVFEKTDLAIEGKSFDIE